MNTKLSILCGLELYSAMFMHFHVNSVHFQENCKFVKTIVHLTIWILTTHLPPD